MSNTDIMSWDEYLKKSQNPPSNLVELGTPEPQASPAVQEAPSMSSRLKGVMEQYSPEVRQKMIERFSSSSGGGLASLFAGISQAVAGQDPTKVQNSIADRNRAVLTDNLDIFDAGKKGAIENATFGKTVQDLEMDEPGSPYHGYLIELLPQQLRETGGRVPASKLEKMVDRLYKKEPGMSREEWLSRQQESDKLQRARGDEAYARGADEREANRALKDEANRRAEDEAAAKRRERVETISTPWGPARDADSAKKARDSFKTLTEAGQIIDELIRLREENGSETLPTEAKRRMQQLAEQARLVAKGEGMFNLGVLTGPDVEVLKAALFGDPTEYGWNVLSRLKNARGYITRAEGLAKQAYSSGGSPSQDEAPVALPVKKGLSPEEAAAELARRRGNVR